MAIGTSIKVSLDTKAIARGFAKIKAGFKRLGKSVASAGRMMMAPFLKLQAILAPVLAATGGIFLLKNASKQAADLELMSKSFETLLGSVDAATKRIKELERFSVTTPFEPAEVIKSSKLLETLGGEIIATGEGLRMVGDAASVAGQPLEEVALHIGRIFGALTSGTSAGESVGRLQELGLIAGSAKLGFERLAASQKKGETAALDQAQALSLLQQVLSKTDGAMIELSKTFGGRVSTMRGNWTALMIAMGEGLNMGLGDVVDSLNKSLPNMTEQFRRAGETIGNVISTMNAAFSQGNLGKLLVSTFEFAVAKMGEELLAVMLFVSNAFVQQLTKQLSETGIGKLFGVTAPTEPLPSLSGFRGATEGMFQSGQKWNAVQDQVRIANLEKTENWLRQMAWTEEQILDTLNMIRMKSKTATF